MVWYNPGTGNQNTRGAIRAYIILLCLSAHCPDNHRVKAMRCICAAWRWCSCVILNVQVGYARVVPTLFEEPKVARTY